MTDPQVPHCGGFSCEARAPRHTGFGSRSSWAQEWWRPGSGAGAQGWWRPGSGVWCRALAAVARGIFRIRDPALSPALAGRFFTTEPPGALLEIFLQYKVSCRNVKTIYFTPVPLVPPGVRTLGPGVRCLEWACSAAFWRSPQVSPESPSPADKPLGLPRASGERVPL